MKKLLFLLLFLPSLVNGQFLNVGNTWQRQVVGADTTYRMVMGGPGYWYPYTRKQIDNKFVNLTTNQTIAGNKTFTGQLVLKESSSSSDFTKGLRFPNSAFGGGDDVSGLRLYALSGETQTLELYVGDNSDDIINFKTGVGSAEQNDNVKVNGNTILNAANYNNYTPGLTGSGASGSWSINAATVTTNANLTGDVTSVGNATTYNAIVPSTKGGSGVNNAGTLTWGAGGTLGTNAYSSTAYLPVASPTFTGTLTGPEATISGDLIVKGADATNLFSSIKLHRFGSSVDFLKISTKSPTLNNSAVYFNDGNGNGFEFASGGVTGFALSASGEVSITTTPTTATANYDLIVRDNSGGVDDGKLKVIASSVGRPYKSYVVVMTQSSTTAPAIDYTLENSIGAIVWTRAGTGHYTATLTGAFVSSKTWTSLTTNSIVSSAAMHYEIYKSNANTIDIYTYTGTTLSDDMLYQANLEIRVYN